jgi:hypothetical protein
MPTAPTRNVLGISSFPRTSGYAGRVDLTGTYSQTPTPGQQPGLHPGVASTPLLLRARGHWSVVSTFRQGGDPQGAP